MEMFKTGDDVYHHMQRVHGTFDGVHFIDENGELIANPEEIEAQRAALEEVERRRRDSFAELNTLAMVDDTDDGRRNSNQAFS
ncbi:hypothetical protein CSOJ01_03851 [Colletotrichum sojae]|uniref:Uncharacterized protein n=1 Tax=Colletotrichum sojae TaxID=2175907 RepID=A0A8H6JKU4_9PEZI|nr:hypothetical protein CSOJ01_03851 [Colletotrichum sojae]